MLTEAIRLIVMLAVAVGSAYLAKLENIPYVPQKFALIIFILIGTGIGYVAGGIIGRKLSNTVSWIEEKAKKSTASELVMGTGGLILSLIVSSLIAAPIKDALKLISPITVPYAVILIYFVFGYLGFDIFSKKGQGIEFLPSADYSSKLAEDNLMIIDSCAAIDGRIAELIRLGFLNGKIIIPKFIINELQGIADSNEELKRVRGRRGLEILEEISENIITEIYEKDYPQLVEPDDKLVKLASDLSAVLVTNDYNLAKIAILQKIKVLNINELAVSLRPVVLPGESLNILIIKEGKEKSQGIGYLDDGTMVVVEGGKKLIGENVETVVSTVLQTSTGKMVFAKVRNNNRLVEQSPKK